MDRSFPTLLARMQELRDLHGIIGLATWDQETYLPAKAADARAHQLSTLQGLYHERLVDSAAGRRAGLGRGRSRASTADQRAMVRVLDAGAGAGRARAPRAGEGAGRGPEPCAGGLAPGPEGEALLRVSARAWRRLLALRREQADAYGHEGERYDALLEGYEPGMRVARLTPVLTALRDALIPMVAALRLRAPAGGGRVPGPPLRRARPQWRFTLRLLEAMGFDLEAGRQDRSIHPFTGGTHPLDVRLTTRLDEENPLLRAVQHHPRGGPRAVRAGLRRGALPHAAGGRALDGAARVAVAPVGEHGGPEPRPSGSTSSRSCARRFPQALAGVDLDGFHAARQPGERRRSSAPRRTR